MQSYLKLQHNWRIIFSAFVQKINIFLKIFPVEKEFAEITILNVDVQASQFKRFTKEIKNHTI